MSIRFIKYPSLYFNWLPRSFLKGLLPIQLIFSDEFIDIGGVYYPKQNYIGKDFSLIKKSAILIPLINNKNERELASTIAHELRHHYQACKYGIKYNSPVWRSGNNYKKNIITYFNLCEREMDALKFQNRYAPCDHALEWEEWIIKSNEL